jgi:hypothetical protein
MAALRAATATLADFSEFGDADTIACGGARLPVGATSATVHRLVRYVAHDVDDVGAKRSLCVQFEAHTDGTWFTVIPCAAQP